MFDIFPNKWGSGCFLRKRRTWQDWRRCRRRRQRKQKTLGVSHLGGSPRGDPHLYALEGCLWYGKQIRSLRSQNQSILVDFSCTPAQRHGEARDLPCTQNVHVCACRCVWVCVYKHTSKWRSCAGPAHTDEETRRAAKGIPDVT